MHPDDREKDPAVVLPYLLGRKLRAEEVYDAFGVKKSTYYDKLSKGSLITADSLIRVARYFDINPANLLVRYGLLDAEDVMDSAAGVVRSVEEVEPLLGKSLTTSERRNRLTRMARLLRTAEYSVQSDVPPLR